MSPNLATEVVKTMSMWAWKRSVDNLAALHVALGSGVPFPCKLSQAVAPRERTQNKQCSPVMIPSKHTAFLTLPEGCSVVDLWRLNSNCSSLCVCRSCSTHHFLHPVNAIPTWRITCMRVNVFWGHITLFSAQYLFLEWKGFINNFSYSSRYTILWCLHVTTQIILNAGVSVLCSGW